MAEEEAHNQANHTPENTNSTEEPQQSSEASQSGEGKSGGPVSDEQLKEMAVQVVKSVYDPEIPVDIYELGLIYEITV